MGMVSSLGLPGPASAKNAIMSQAAADLGLGDQLRQQVEDEVQKRKKQMGDVSTVNTNALSPAALAIFGGGTKGPGVV